jgi:hypothetical protein
VFLIIREYDGQTPPFTRNYSFHSPDASRGVDFQLHWADDPDVITISGVVFDTIWGTPLGTRDPQEAVLWSEPFSLELGPGTTGDYWPGSDSVRSPVLHPGPDSPQFTIWSDWYFTLTPLDGADDRLRGYFFYVLTYDHNPVPEPSGAILAISGLLLLGIHGLKSHGRAPGVG